MATRAIEEVRGVLPDSPYRDDTPHLTIMRTIETPTPMSDAELSQDMERLLHASEALPLTATVNKPASSIDPLFRWFSSQLLLRASPEIRLHRERMLRTLRANNYAVGIVSRLTFFPHISVRLGVPYNEQARAMAERSFSPGTELTFNRWIILRDIKKDGNYLVREVTI